jgi:hypothetical protein
MYPFCNPSLATPCAYISDSSEVIRANYRAQQDIKGLIRFLSGRQQLDSTDLQNVFLLGESAGGFIALATAFMDRPSEKPADCGWLPAAAPPDADMTAYGCSASGAGLQRPDLGGIDGDLYLSSSAYTVRGVASIFGGVLDTSIFQQNGAVIPRVYLFHQGSDVIVHYDRGRLLSRLSYECFAPNNICQPVYNYPMAYGGERIGRIFSQSGANAPVYRSEIVYNYEYLNDCFDNGHSVDNIAQRTAEVADFFSQGIDTASNHPGWSCQFIGVNEPELPVHIRVFPNPASDRLQVDVGAEVLPLEFTLYAAEGQALVSGTVRESINSLPLTNYPSGNYYLWFPALGIARPFVLIR